jgi:hypothetical protein
MVDPNVVKIDVQKLLKNHNFKFIYFEIFLELHLVDLGLKFFII